MNTTTTTATDTSTAIYFGAGRYSDAAGEFYNDLQRLFKMSSKGAEKIARQWMSDFGAAMKNERVNASVSGKPTKNGELTLKEAAKAKVIATLSISLMRLCAYLDEGFKFGLNPTKSEFVLNETLATYIAEMSKE